MAIAAFARRRIACVNDQRASHFGMCNLCFQLARHRCVTLKPLVLGDHLRSKQQDDAGVSRLSSPTIVVANEP
jgi:hypothetical protein